MVAISDERDVDSLIVPAAGRRELGNVLILSGSIERVGLLHPIVVNTRNEVIAGRRRLAAVKRLGWSRVPVTVAATLDDALLALMAERDENTCRERLTTEDMVEIGERLEAIERPKARERKSSGTNQHTEGSGKFPEGSRGDTRDKVAAAQGVSGKTYEKAKKVVEAVRGDPVGNADLAEAMSKPGAKVDPIYREAKRRVAKGQTSPAASGPPKSSPGMVVPCTTTASTNPTPCFRQGEAWIMSFFIDVIPCQVTDHPDGKFVFVRVVLGGEAVATKTAIPLDLIHVALADIGVSLPHIPAAAWQNMLGEADGEHPWKYRDWGADAVWETDKPAKQRLEALGPPSDLGERDVIDPG